MKVGRRTGIGTIAAMLAVIYAEPCAQAQDFPTKPVKFINQGGPGSGPDVICRIVADYLGRLWGQQVVVLNHPGAGGMIAARAAIAAEPDGYTLYIPGSTTYTVLPESQKLPFDLNRDLVPVGFVSEQPMIITVRPALGINSLDELIVQAKAKPGEILYAGTPRGQLPHLTGELFKSRADIDMTFVPYPGSSQSLQDTIGGRISVMIENPSVLSGLIRAGTLKALAVSSPTRLPIFPDLPTVAETLPGFAAMGWFVVVAPAGAPQPIVARLNRDLNAVLDRPEVRQRFQELGSFVRTMAPAQVTEYIRNEQTTWRPIIRQIGLTGQ